MHQACGYHASMIDNFGEHPLIPDQFKCPFCSREDRQRRVWEAEDERLEKRIGKPSPEQEHPLDGVVRFLRPATADEIEQARQRREGGEQ